MKLNHNYIQLIIEQNPGPTHGLLIGFQASGGNDYQGIDADCTKY